MKQESKQKKNVGTSVMGNDIETTQNTMHVLDENKVLKKIQIFKSYKNCNIKKRLPFSDSLLESMSL